jgi:hypothetical protein
MVAQILKLVNSGFYGLRKTVESVEHAISLLGIINIKQVVYSASIMEFFSDDEQLEWNHSYSSSMLMGHFIRENELPGINILPMAMLMHDLGKVVLRRFSPKKYKVARQHAIEENTPSFMVENAMLQINHAEVGGVLLAKWDSADEIVKPVLQHHTAEVPEDFVFETARGPVRQLGGLLLPPYRLFRAARELMNAPGIEEIDKNYWLNKHARLIETLENGGPVQGPESDTKNLGRRGGPEPARKAKGASDTEDLDRKDSSVMQQVEQPQEEEPSPSPELAAMAAAGPQSFERTDTAPIAASGDESAESQVAPDDFAERRPKTPLELNDTAHFDINVLMREAEEVKAGKAALSEVDGATAQAEPAGNPDQPRIVTNIRGSSLSAQELKIMRKSYANGVPVGEAENGEDGSIDKTPVNVELPGNIYRRRPHASAEEAGASEEGAVHEESVAAPAEAQAERLSAQEKPQRPTQVINRKTGMPVASTLSRTRLRIRRSVARRSRRRRLSPPEPEPEPPAPRTELIEGVPWHRPLRPAYESVHRSDSEPQDAGTGEEKFLGPLPALAEGPALIIELTRGHRRPLR